MTSGTRERILEASNELFQRQGMTGTGIKQILGLAVAPFSSLYHFFPGGKEQLAAETIERSGAMYQALVESVFDAAPDIVTGVADCFAAAAERLRTTDYADACPIATVALEVASTNDTLREATARVFDRWVDAGTARFAAAGVENATARDLAVSVIMLLEGAFVLSRASKSTDALDVAGRTAVAATRAALASRPKRRASQRGGSTSSTSKPSRSSR